DQVRLRLQDHRTQIVLDCEGLDFINSSGLGALVSVLKDVRLAGGRLVLCRLAPYVDEIFEITGLKRVFDVYRSVGDALASFASQARERLKSVRP
ncbi:MAG TPA: STAS domain-containing protein, partial [Acidobacteriota bacterium]|nr:STAS domain-containing protein [Acidobacteriota bacterium]